MVFAVFFLIEQLSGADFSAERARPLTFLPDFFICIDATTRDIFGAMAKPKAPKTTLEQWKSTAKKLVKDWGIDLMKPEGFSIYLLAVHGPNRDPEVNRIMGDHVTHFPDKPYKARMKAWLDALAPKGALVFRGIKGLELTAENLLVEMARYNSLNRASHGEKDWDNFSLNVAYDVPHFVPPWRRSKGKDGVLFVHHMKPGEMISFGGDSESGDLQEAEVYLKTYTPKPSDRVFILSKKKNMGKPVSKQDIERFALKEHLECKVNAGIFGDSVTVELHPNVPKEYLTGVKCKKRSSVPPGYSWYEMDLSKAQKPSAGNIPQSCKAQLGRKGSMTVTCSSASATKAALKILNGYLSSARK